MGYKIKNELKKADYIRLKDFLKERESASIELYPSTDLGFISISPLFVSVEGFGYSITGEARFQLPIGLDVVENLKLSEEMSRNLTVNFRSIKLSMVATEVSKLESQLNKCLKMLERIVNYTCIMLDKQVEQTFTINSEWLDKQLDIILQIEEMKKRGEIPRPYGTIHAKNTKDAEERAGDLIPLYKEHDKTYLYDAKLVYFLLPHDFVTNLLRCDDVTMVREEEFGNRGKEVLRNLVYRKYLRKHETLDGTVCYYGLDGKTRRYLVKKLKHKIPRL